MQAIKKDAKQLWAGKIEGTNLPHAPHDHEWCCQFHEGVLDADSDLMAESMQPWTPNPANHPTEGDAELCHQLQISITLQAYRGKHQMRDR